jgi:hypothetical protein
MKRHLLATGLAVALIATPVALAGSPAKKPVKKAETIAVIGDIPYGDPLIAEFPADIQEINADPGVSRVLHLGDIKNGSSRCDTSYFNARLADFQRFADPLVYTPGDNEWTDCHRANNGGYVPTERLATIRDLFFPKPGKTLGQHKVKVDYQNRRFPENTMWEQSDVVLGMVHVVGSNDDQAPWFTDRKDAGGTPIPETPAEAALQAREFLPRESAAIRWIDKIFDEAQDQHAPGVLISMQADMWDPAAEQSAFAPIKAVLADRAARFGKPVLLLEGDSHLFEVDTPTGMPANLTRAVVEGSTNIPHEWLRLHIDPSSPKVFSCENIEFVTKVVRDCPPGPLAP